MLALQKARALQQQRKVDVSYETRDASLAGIKEQEIKT